MSPPNPTFWQRWIAHWWCAWGHSLCHMGNRSAERVFYEQSVAAFGRARRWWPTLAAAYYHSGFIRGRELNEYEPAVADLTQAIELAPDWPDPYLQRGLFHRFHGALDMALADLQHYLMLGGDTYWRGEAERYVRQIQDELAEQEKS